MLLTGSLPLFLRGPGVGPSAAADAPLWRPAGKVAARYLGRGCTTARTRGSGPPSRSATCRRGPGPRRPEAALDLR
jgi:hypothetical protein